MTDSTRHPPSLLTRRLFVRQLLVSGLMLGMATPLWAEERYLKLPAPPQKSGAVAASRTEGGGVSPPTKPRPPRILMIDPGHGGRDPGALGKALGTAEKDVTLDIARRMADKINASAGITAHLTRDDDVFVPLDERARLGREKSADLFISVHADSAPSALARGLSVYTLSEKATDDFSRSLADQENRADLMGGLDLPPADKEVTAILFDLATRHTQNVAQHARSSFVRQIGKEWPLLERPMRAANFAVLRSPSVPSMLIETGFLSNPRDEKMLADPRQRDKIARIMAREMTALLKSSLFGG